MPTQKQQSFFTTTVLWVLIILYNSYALYTRPNIPANSKLIHYAFIAYSVYGLFRVYRARSRNRQLAAKLLAEQVTLYSAEHEYQTVQLADFPTLDANFYTDYQQWLSAEGFRFIADVEDVTLSAVYPAMRTCLRLMADAEGSVIACLAYVNKSIQLVELETEFSDGTFIMTSFQPAAATQQFPGIQSAHVPWAEGVPKLVSVHRQRVQSYLADHPQSAIIKAPALRDIIAQQHRQQYIKNAVKADQGFLTREDIQRAAKPGQEEAAGRLADHVESLKKR